MSDFKKMVETPVHAHISSRGVGAVKTDTHEAQGFRHFLEKMWNHTDECYSGELSECDCGLVEVLALFDELAEPTEGDDSRWVRRMRMLERRQRLAVKALDGKMDIALD